MSIFSVCCGCWRREGDLPYLPAPVPEAEVFSAEAFALGPPAAVRGVRVLDDDSPTTGSERRHSAYIIHNNSVVLDARGPTEELYDGDWNALQARSRGAEHWQRARRGIQTSRAMDSLLDEVRENQTTELYDNDWSTLQADDTADETAYTPLESTPRAIGNWNKARRAMEIKGTMDTVLGAVRRRQVEELYEQDWTTPQVSPRLEWMEADADAAASQPAAPALAAGPGDLDGK
mmetsp:Transcript_116835/g.342128  ORF Transcript_116835/g.342128 Transcript_116835/m.342128 type:complete len:233 (+) Transcript_116835:104-802(+)